MTMKTVMAGGLAALALATAACSSDGDEPGVATIGEGGTAASSSVAPEADAEAALLEWAACMRAEGVDVPDPQVDADGNLQIIGGGGPGFDPNDPDIQAAFEACQDRLPNGGELELDPDQEAALADAQLAFAECMNEQGIDVPEPTAGEGIGPGLALEIDPNDPDVQAALEECLPLMEDVFPAPGGGN